MTYKESHLLPGHLLILSGLPVFLHYTGPLLAEFEKVLSLPLVLDE